jgi:ATP-dependent Clp protease protease subunit
MTKAILLAVGFLLALAVVLLVWRAKSSTDGTERRSESIADGLIHRRVVLLNGEVNDETATLVIAEMLFLQDRDPEAPIHLEVDSQGGSAVAGVAIIRTIKDIRPPVHTLCRKRAHGIAAVIVASGRKGHRQAREEARLSITPFVWSEGQVEDEAGRHRLLQAVTGIVVERTGQPREAVQVDFQRGRAFDAQGAKEYGLIDAITK